MQREGEVEGTERGCSRGEGVGGKRKRESVFDGGGERENGVKTHARKS